MNAALLIIDVQKEFIGHLSKEQVFIDTMEYINETAELFRKARKQ
jgi:nicotinamidase-related amidase